MPDNEFEAYAPPQADLNQAPQASASIVTCGICRRDPPLGQATLSANIGMLLVRQTRRVSGPMCSGCFGAQYARMTLTNAFLGWWGVISLFVTPVWLTKNSLEVFRFYRAAGNSVGALDQVRTVNPNLIFALIALGLVSAGLTFLIYYDFAYPDGHAMGNAIIHGVLLTPVLLSFIAAVKVKSRT